MWLIRRLSSSQLVRGSLVVLLAGNFANFGNFLYSLSMGRLLGPEVYGELGSILSFFSLLAVPLAVVGLSVVKIVSALWGKEDYGKIRSFLGEKGKKLFFFWLAIGLVILTIGPWLVDFLRLNSFWPVLILAMMVLVGGLTTVNRAALQGTLSFIPLAVNNVAEVTVKFFVAVGLVFLGFGLIGALFGPLVGGITGFFLAIMALRKVLPNNGESEENPVLSLRDSFFPVLLVTLILTLFLSVDVILVRHFFSAREAGEYTALSTLGKIVYYAVGPVISVMFPIISARSSRHSPYLSSLLGTLVLALGLGLVIVFIFSVFPRLIIGTLLGSRYFGVIPYLGFYTFFAILFSLNSILTHFLLSVSHYRPIWLLFLVSLLPGALILIFHSSVVQVIWVNILVSFIYLTTAAYFVIQKEWRFISFR